MKRRVFYSFYYKEDVMRASQVRNIGVVEGSKIASDNEWEEVKKGGDAAIKKWIDENIENRSCLIVLIGENTYDRKWVDYEIKHAIKNNMGLLGIYIHNLKDTSGNKSKKGKNPFEKYSVSGVPLTSIAMTYEPSANDAYNDIKDNLGDLIEKAIKKMENFKNSLK